MKLVRNASAAPVTQLPRSNFGSSPDLAAVLLALGVRPTESQIRKLRQGFLLGRAHGAPDAERNLENQRRGERTVRLRKIGNQIERRTIADGLRRQTAEHRNLVAAGIEADDGADAIAIGFGADQFQAQAAVCGWPLRFVAK